MAFSWLLLAACLLEDLCCCRNVKVGDVPRGDFRYEDWDCGLLRDVGGDVRRCDSAAAWGDLLRGVGRPGMAGGRKGRFVVLFVVGRWMVWDLVMF